MKDMWGLVCYILVSTIVVVLLLKLFKENVKEKERKDRVLKIFAIATLVLHYSSLYVDYFSNATASVDGTMLLPIFPCNLAMWMLVIVAFIKKKNTVFFTMLAEMTFYIGVVGGILGIVLNEAYFNTPQLGNWNVLKGLLSHTTMLIGCSYLFVGDYIRIRVKNMYSIALGLLLLIMDGMITLMIFHLFKLELPNTMYLLKAPYESLPFINTWTIGALGLLGGFIITITYEHFKLEKSERWISKLKEKKNKK